MFIQVHSLAPRAANISTYREYIRMTLHISRTFRPFDDDIVWSVMAWKTSAFMHIESAYCINSVKGQLCDVWVYILFLVYTFF